MSEKVIEDFRLDSATKMANGGSTMHGSIEIAAATIAEGMKEIAEGMKDFGATASTNFILATGVAVAGGLIGLWCYLNCRENEIKRSIASKKEMMDAQHAWMIANPEIGAPFCPFLY